MTSVTIKRCSNPDCIRRERIYLNGASVCKLCGSPLIATQQDVPGKAVEALDQMVLVRNDVRRLLRQTPRSLQKIQ